MQVPSTITLTNGNSNRNMNNVSSFNGFPDNMTFPMDIPDKLTSMY